LLLLVKFFDVFEGTHLWKKASVSTARLIYQQVLDVWNSHLPGRQDAVDELVRDVW
jgi:hypothetical protein